MTIKKIEKAKDYPWALLLLADPDQGTIEDYLFQSECFIYLYETEVCGVIVLKQQAGSVFEVMNLAVLERYQGRGIGRKLLQFTENQLINHYQCPLTVVIKTGDLPSPALHLYESTGFVVQELIEDYFVHTYSEPIYEMGERLRNQVILEKVIINKFSELNGG